MPDEKFKKLYKEANDRIKGDRRVIDAAFEKAASEKTASEGTKKRTNIIKYSFLGTAAAAIIVICAIAGNFELFRLDENAATESPAADAERETEAGNAKASTESDAAAETEGEPQTVNEGEKENVAKSDKETPARTESGATPAEAESAPDVQRITGSGEKKSAEDNGGEKDESVEESDENDAEDMSNYKPTEPKQSYTLTISGQSGGGSGGGSSGAVTGLPKGAGDATEAADDYGETTMTFLDESLGETAIYTAEEYFNYIGTDLSALSLPYGMELDIMPEYTLSVDENGEISGDTAFFTAQSAEKRLEIMTSRIESVSWAVDMYKKTGENTSEFDDGANVTVYAVKDGASFTLSFENFEKAERDSVVNQIIGK